MWSFNKKKKKDVKPNIIWLDETDSTNNYLKNYIPASDEKDKCCRCRLSESW